MKNDENAREEAKKLIRRVLATFGQGRTTRPLIEQHEAFQRDHPELDWPALFREVLAELREEG